jgi:hypothetical protein
MLVFLVNSHYELSRDTHGILVRNVYFFHPGPPPRGATPSPSRVGVIPYISRAPVPRDMKETRGTRGRAKSADGQDHSNRPVLRATQNTGFPTCVSTWNDLKFRYIGLAVLLIKITRDGK